MVLVVMDILDALYINNWNEERGTYLLVVPSNFISLFWPGTILGMTPPQKNAIFKKIIYFLTLVLLSCCSTDKIDKQNYQYTTDLTQVDNGRIPVELRFSGNLGDTAYFCKHSKLFEYWKEDSRFISPIDCTASQKSDGIFRWKTGNRYLHFYSLPQ